jgi:hypothetical protein
MTPPLPIQSKFRSQKKKTPAALLIGRHFD